MPPPEKVPVLVADDEQNIRFVLRELLGAEGFPVTESPDGEDAVAKVLHGDFPVVLMDVRMPRLDGMSALRKIREAKPDTVVLVITAHGTQKTALEAVQAGAYDYFQKPFDLNEVKVVVRRAAEKARLLAQLRRMESDLRSRYSFDNIVGQSPAMREVYDLINRVVDNDVTVLVTGESGTGKEVIAGALHNNGPRAKGPLVKVNTVAIPETLLESELFGHERGSFTGAVQQKIGKVEAAHGGTLFLDEIGDMPLTLQSKLLRVLQEREIERVGSTKTVKVDIRVVCATNRDLAKQVEKGEFREDLYYRINVLPIHLPPLRKRREDIPLLIDHFIQVYNARLNRNIRGLDAGALRHFLNYGWPGNIRELENTIQRVMLMARGETITAADLPPTLRGGAPPSDAAPGAAPIAGLDLAALLDKDDFAQPLADRLQAITDVMEKHLIRAALEKANGHRQETADLLGISRKSLHNKMVRYGMFEDEDEKYGTRPGRG
ncbi:MAG: sigma-54 dependent transcriptional regulator [Candidatus Sumerlaeia bacterium]|nr:sigma-54 dependent transcriptional regulator [Candidatus Sumerlaeia bacterium]